jgi:hypothetical protein
MEFPAMLYRRGSMFEWDGEMFDYLIVNDAEEVAEALDDGWCQGKPPADPLDHDGNGRKGGGRARKGDAA